MPAPVKATVREDLDVAPDPPEPATLAQYVEPAAPKPPERPTRSSPFSQPARSPGAAPADLPPDPPVANPAPEPPPLTASSSSQTQSSDGDRCLTPEDLKRKSPLWKITDDISLKLAPGEQVPQDCSLGNAQYQPREWQPVCYTWTAPGTCNKPLYFEEVQLERYGNSLGPIRQPIVSAAHFFATVPLLPYYMGAYPPGECQYTLGYYRPGSCNPYYLDPFPISVRGGIFEGLFWTGAPLMF